MDTNKKMIEFKITGLVQGVGFRYFVYRHATALELQGYVMNLYDDSVAVVVEGESEKINILHELLKSGPSRSVVRKINSIENPFSGNFSRFDIR